MTAKVQLVGGGFQDAEGNLLANGYLEFVLSQDSSVTGVGNIAAGITIKIQLDSVGNAASSASSPAAADQYLWGNDVLNTPNTFYKVTGFTAEGQPAFGPNNQQVIGSSPFDLGTWVPNTVFQWTPPVQQVSLNVDGVAASSQIRQNLESTDDSVTITDEGNGNINFQAGGAFQNVIGCIMAGVLGGSNVFSSGANLGMNMSSVNGNSRQAVTDGPTATEGTFGVYQAAQTTSASALMDGVPNISLGILKDWFCKITIIGMTSSRYWNGITDCSTTNMGATFFSDTPAANFVGFRFSTGAGDTNYQAVCQTGSSNQTVVDTGVAPGSVADKLEFKPSGGNVLFYINGTLVATISTNVPSNSLGMATLLSNDCDGDISISDFEMAFYYCLCHLELLG